MKIQVIASFENPQTKAKSRVRQWFRTFYPEVWQSARNRWISLGGMTEQKKAEARAKKAVGLPEEAEASEWQPDQDFLNDVMDRVFGSEGEGHDS